MSIQNSTLPIPTPTPTPTQITNVTITNFTPISPVNNFIGESRDFHIIIDQIADITWYINETLVQFNGSINDSSYNNTSAVLGIWNISATANNTHGNVTYTWEWIVTNPPPPPVAPKINSYFPLFSPVNNSVGSSTKFGISTDQNVDIQWLINGNQIQFNGSINGSSYNNTSAAIGIWNVSAIVTNENGSATQSWIWNVTPTIDDIPPQIIINSPIDEMIYILNQNLIADWSVSDASGITSSTGTYPNKTTINTTSVGKKNFIVFATDNAGNTNTKNEVYYIQYKFSGFLDPIENNGGSIFKVGSKVQIRFRLNDANLNSVATAIAKLDINLITPIISGKDLKPSSSDVATTGGFFKYDSRLKEYRYILDTKGFQPGTWKITTIIDDGSSYAVNISLKKS